MFKWRQLIHHVKLVSYNPNSLPLINATCRKRFSTSTSTSTNVFGTQNVNDIQQFIEKESKALNKEVENFDKRLLKLTLQETNFENDVENKKEIEVSGELSKRERKEIAKKLKEARVKEFNLLKSKLTKFWDQREIRSRSFKNGIPPNIYNRARVQFLNHLNVNLTLRQSIAQSKISDDELFREFVQFTKSIFPTETSEYKSKTVFGDLTNPHLEFPLARQMKRRIIYHSGPTNSGKTFTALEALKQSQNGVYCGPLRLLALEIFQNLNGSGVPCHLITGQEKKMVPGAQVISCTIEMLNLDYKFDVAVIDEIQMIGDSSRAFAWSNAILGLQAKEIHLCGDPSAIGLIKKITSLTNDYLEIKNYDRLTPLTLTSPITSLKQIQKGDAVIGFQRRDLYNLKAKIEKMTNHKCSLVYGKLPPEVRSEQARLFNDPNSKIDVLVASDAIGMGLNLNIKRVIFSSMQKFDGAKSRALTLSQIRQIAGRAGRAKGLYQNGTVTTIGSKPYNYLKQAMESGPLPPIKKAGLSLTFERIQAYCDKFPSSLEKILCHLEEISYCDQNYFLCELDQMKAIAAVIRDYEEGISLDDQFTFCKAPTDATIPREEKVLRSYLKYFSKKELVPFSSQPPSLPSYDKYQPSDIAFCEAFIKEADCYLWLSERFPVEFQDDVYVRKIREQVIHELNTAFKG